uniref:Syntaxin-8 n=1 Tax=Chelonoidis abingdonii TaxID=106734 RepID=A0A8C0IM26_CHEAB
MYDSTCHIAQEIAEKIQERNRCQRNGENSTKLNVTIRSLLQNLKVKIDQLKDLLLRAISTRQITQLEGDRRQNLVDDLLTRQRQLEASYKNDGTESDVIRYDIAILKEQSLPTSCCWQITHCWQYCLKYIYFTNTIVGCRQN